MTSFNISSASQSPNKLKPGLLVSRTKINISDKIHRILENKFSTMTQSPSKNQIIYDAVAENYDEDPETQAFFQFEKDEVLEMLAFSRGEKVLDIGCGTGKYINIFPNGVEIFGTDISAGMMEQAAKKYPHLKARYSVSDVSKHLPFPDGFFDKINCAHVLKFLTSEGDLEAAFLEIARVLKKGGMFVFTNNHPERNFDWNDYELTKKDVLTDQSTDDDEPIAMKLHTISDYQKACKKAGLTIEEKRDILIKDPSQSLLTSDSFTKVQGKKIILSMKITK